MNSESVKIHPHTEAGEGSRSSRWGRGFTLPHGAAAKGGDEEEAVGRGAGLQEQADVGGGLRPLEDDAGGRGVPAG